MKPLNPIQQLRIWERGFSDKFIDRAIAILTEAEPETPIEQLVRLPIGQRDRQLLAIREATFGSHFQALMPCPECGEQLEFGFFAADLRREDDPRESIVSTSLSVGEFVLQLRLPDSTDLAAAAKCPDAVTARRTLARRCIGAAQQANKPITADAVPDNLIADIARHLEAIDPDTTLEVICPICQSHTESLFDIANFLWTEIEAEALRLFRDVHQLAFNYGWRESDILAMTPLRRRIYLELLQS